MKGQWIGKYDGDHAGDILINIDDRGTYFSGEAFTTPEDKKLPGTVIQIRTPDKNPTFSFSAITLPFDVDAGLALFENDFQTKYPGISHSRQTLITGRFEENKLIFNSKTDLGTSTHGEIIRKPISDTSDISGEKMSWDNFKIILLNYAKRKLLFRGQEEGWKLRTTFHRYGRADLLRFRTDDVPSVHRHLSARTKHYFDMQNADEVGSFWSLMQHHGYPTPLLDWTYSPYVAAFFAFREVGKDDLSGSDIRIYVFDEEKWRNHYIQIFRLDVSRPYFSIWPSPAIENERAVPQQSISTGTNVDDIEAYISLREVEANTKFLWAIDIPRIERNKVMKDLSYMGVSAGSLFPGLDGACEELRERNFDK